MNCGVKNFVKFFTPQFINIQIYIHINEDNLKLKIHCLLNKCS